jgi:hypothetical protein
LIGVSLAARLRRHVADDHIERSTKVLWIDREGIERSNLCVRGQGNLGIVQVDSENVPARPDALGSVQRP